MPRQFFVGGNFKCNPTTIAQKKAIVKVLNEATLDSSVGTQPVASYRSRVLIVRLLEVVIAPPSLYLLPFSETIRKEIKVAAQNAYVKASGAFTGEIRYIVNLFIPISH